MIAIQTTQRNGLVIGAVQVEENDELMLISDGGTLVRTHASEISVVGRNTQGVTLIQLGENEKLVGLERIPEIDAKRTSGDEIEDEDQDEDQDEAQDEVQDENV